MITKGTLTQLQQSGASTDEIIKWNGSVWTPSLIDNNSLDNATGGIYKGSGEIQDGVQAKVFSNGIFQFIYNDGAPAIWITDTDSTSLRSNDGGSEVSVGTQIISLTTGGDAIFGGDNSTTIRLANLTGSAGQIITALGDGTCVWDDAPISSFAWATNTLGSPNYGATLTDYIFHNGPSLLFTDSIDFEEPDGIYDYDTTQVGLYIKRSVDSNDNSPAIHVRQYSPLNTGDTVSIALFEFDPVNAPEAVPFTMNLNYFDEPSAAGDNTTFHMGFNMNKQGGLYDTSNPGSVLQFESKFGAATGDDQEIWFAFKGITSGDLRSVYMTANRNDCTGSVLSLSGETIYINNGVDGQTKGYWTGAALTITGLDGENGQLNIFPELSGDFSIIRFKDGDFSTYDVLKSARNTGTLNGVADVDVTEISSGRPTQIGSSHLFFQDDGTGTAIISTVSTAAMNLHIGENSTVDGYLGARNARLTVHQSENGGIYWNNPSGSTATDYWRMTKGFSGLGHDDLLIVSETSTLANAPFVIRKSTHNVGIKISPSNVSAPLHVHSQAATTGNIFRLENNSANIDFFVTTATPEASVTGSIGDLAIDTTNGILYIKRTGTATNTGWVAM